jgi:cysteine desulfurase/selenocysteine lyase
MKQLITPINHDFPILQSQIRGKKLIYLDNAATTQKPQIVIDALTTYYREYNSNIHRGAHYLAHKATEHYEAVREQCKSFIGASEAAEINFTYGTTFGINVIAQGLGKILLKPGDEILLSTMEHHSNIVPWQMVSETTGASIKVIPLLDNQQLDITAFKNLVSERTKIVSIVYASNALGVINPLREIIAIAHQYGALVIADGAQATAHMPINVVDLDVDFYVFSGHKICGPTGVGIMYGKRKLLEQLPPMLGGGEMIKQVSFDHTTYNDLPYKFEAGTPNIADVIALGKAIEYIENIGWDLIHNTEFQLINTATELIRQIDGATIYGDVDMENKVSVLSFNIDGLHPYDLGVLLDQQGIAVRTGHHCCQPLMDTLGISGTVRASFSFYNEIEEVFALETALLRAIKMLR